MFRPIRRAKARKSAILVLNTIPELHASAITSSFRHRQTGGYLNPLRRGLENLVIECLFGIRLAQESLRGLSRTVLGLPADMRRHIRHIPQSTWSVALTFLLLASVLLF